MNLNLTIKHFYHSGFSVSFNDILLVFDYWRGEEGELTEQIQLSEEDIRSRRAVYVFISHEHIDHMDPVVFTWKDWGNVSYIVSSDMPVGTRGRRMAPGDTITLEEGLTVSAFDSTDLGVSFLVDISGFRVFHAGDLNFWHWREESTMKEIDEAEEEFRKAVSPLSAEKIDIAFFPVDPRQGNMYDAGANYFILSVKPRLMIPMHYFHRADTAIEYARTASCRTTEVLAMPGYGDTIYVSVGSDDYIDISFSNTDEVPEPSANDPAASSNSPVTGQAEGEPENSMPSFEDDPFSESDLPVSLPVDSDHEDTVPVSPDQKD